MSTFLRYGISGPKPHLFYGNMQEIHEEGNVVCVGKWMKKYGPIFGYYIGARRVLIIAEPEILKQIQIKRFKQFSHRYRVINGAFQGEPKLNSKLTSAGGYKWKELRTILNQAFTASRLKSSVSGMDDPLNTLIEKIEKYALKGEDFDVYALFQGLTMEIIGRSAFGVATNAQSNPNDEFLLAAKSLFELGPKNVLYALSYMFPEFELLLYPIRRLWLKLRRLFTVEPTGYLMKKSLIILKERRKQNVKRNDLLQAMLDAKINAEGLETMNEDSLTTKAHSSASDQITESRVAVENKKLMKQMNDEEIHYFVQKKFMLESIASLHYTNIKT
ncbi:cytochrome P450 3A8-like protein [Dinothrombium tinctorium]|uniref:Cytochrome P450 3A8-like protein n=1 Tax=Dinothrombium tinctorium TaxID=1965070 RepID=A0A3S3Q3V8_9ACAR|nr:cytochrome P450 3A8-like protein [Dinothrombium tinctorium]